MRRMKKKWKMKKGKKCAKRLLLVICDDKKTKRISGAPGFLDSHNAFENWFKTGLKNIFLHQAKYCLQHN